MPWSKNRCWFPWYAYCLLNPHLWEYCIILLCHIPSYPLFIAVLSSKKCPCPARSRSRGRASPFPAPAAQALSSGSIHSCWWLMSTPDKTKPLFINWRGIPPIVMIWYLNGTFPIKQLRGLLIQGWQYRGLYYPIYWRWLGIIIQERGIPFIANQYNRMAEACRAMLIWSWCSVFACFLWLSFTFKLVTRHLCCKVYSRLERSRNLQLYCN